MRWTERNLAVQGYCLSSDESSALRWGLRFSTGLLFAFGQRTAALILGAILLPVCGVVTVTNFCVPSTLLGIWWRRRGTPQPATQPS